MKLLEFLKLVPVSGKNDYLKTFNCDVYRESVNVGITNNINRVITKQLKRYKVPEMQWEDYFVTDNATAVVVEIDVENGCVLYLLLNNEATLDELVHECLHLAEKILWARDIYHSPATSEVWAYFIQYLFDKVIEIFRIDG